MRISTRLNPGSPSSFEFESLTSTRLQILPVVNDRLGSVRVLMYMLHLGPHVFRVLQIVDLPCMIRVPSPPLASSRVSFSARFRGVVLAPPLGVRPEQSLWTRRPRGVTG